MITSNNTITVEVKWSQLRTMRKAAKPNILVPKNHPQLVRFKQFQANNNPFKYMLIKVNRVLFQSEYLFEIKEWCNPTILGYRKELVLFNMRHINK